MDAVVALAAPSMSEEPEQPPPLPAKKKQFHLKNVARTVLTTNALAKEFTHVYTKQSATSSSDTAQLSAAERCSSACSRLGVLQLLVISSPFSPSF